MPVAHSQNAATKNFLPGNLVRNLAGWVTEGDGTSTLVVWDTPGGGLTFGTDTTDNDCSAWYWGAESVSVATVGNRLGFKAIVQGTDGSTADKRNLFIGFADTGVDVFSDAGALAVFDAIGFSVHEDSNFWRSVAANAGTNGTGAGLSTTAYASATEYVLECDIEVNTLGLDITYKVNGTTLDTGDLSAISTTSFGDMAPYVVIANGTGQIELLSVREFTPYFVGS